MADKTYTLKFQLSDGTVREVSFTSPQGADGEPGADGKSAYAYAKEGGYTGTEEEFAAKLAEEVPVPDWNAAEGEAGNILNRTHYRDWVTVFEESAVPFTLEGGIYGVQVEFPEVLCTSEPPERIRVVWDGTEYSVPKAFLENIPVYGNLSLISSEFEDTQEPFLIIPVLPIIATLDEQDSHSIKISYYGYIPLEKGYLPEDVAYKSISYDYGNMVFDIQRLYTSFTGESLPEFDTENADTSLTTEQFNVFYDLAERNEKVALSDWSFDGRCSTGAGTDSDYGEYRSCDFRIQVFHPSSTSLRIERRLIRLRWYQNTGKTVVTRDSEYWCTVQEIPDTLPNPQKLIFTGAVSGEYDGSGELTIEIPQGAEGETETVLSDNLLDKSILSYGYLFYYGSSGYTMASDGTAYSYYGFVPLRGTGTYRTKFQAGQHASTGTRIALVDDDGNWVCNVEGTLGEVVEDNNWVDFAFTVTQTMLDAGATKIAFDVYSLFYDQTMIVVNREYPSEYIPYGYIEVTTDSGKKQNNVLCEKTAVFLGDSICAGTTVGTDSEYYGYGWGGIIGEANRMNWTNYGKNGGTITHMGADGTCISNIADTAIEEHPTADYVIFEGGCNDADQMKADGLGEISADYETFDTSTFSGALEALILKLVTAYPYARIGYIIPQKMYKGYSDFTAANHIHRLYFDRAVEICQKWGIPVLDLWHGSPLNPKLSTASIYYSDGIQHLTEAGYARITPAIEAFMRSL